MDASFCASLEISLKTAGVNLMVALEKKQKSLDCSSSGIHECLWKVSWQCVRELMKVLVVDEPTEARDIPLNKKPKKL